MVLVVVVRVVSGQDSLTENEKQAILDRHNMLRGQVSPTASDMTKMVSETSKKKKKRISYFTQTSIITVSNVYFY